MICRSKLRTAAVRLAGVIGLLLPLQAAGCATLRPEGPEETWAVRCIATRGSDRTRVANQYADLLKSVRGLRPELVQVIDDGEQAVVYYGRYQRLYDSSGKSEHYQPDHLPDIKLIRELNVRGTDVWPFLLASLESLPSARSAHPEWDLTNANGHYTLLVGVFYNDEKMQSRRFAAEEYCRILREAGDEAYYHHGPSSSSVCIGLFPKEALASVRATDSLTGIVTFKNKIVDPRMLALQQKYPTLIENGNIKYHIIRDPQTGEKKERIPNPSTPATTPRAERAAAEGRR